MTIPCSQDNIGWKGHCPKYCARLTLNELTFDTMATTRILHAISQSPMLIGDCAQLVLETSSWHTKDKKVIKNSHQVFTKGKLTSLITF